MSVYTVAPLTAAAITAGAQISKGKPPRIRLLFAGIAGAVMLSIIGRYMPGPARMFAGLIIIGTMLGPGYDLVAALSRLIKE